jgi:hypothetical protein
VKTYTARLGTRITAGVDARLRQLALIRRQRLSHILDELLDAALPGPAELAAQLTVQLAGFGQDSDAGGDGDDH